MRKYGKTRQFRDIIEEVVHLTRFSGLDKNGDPIYNDDPLPTLMFTGSVKLHGTNASIWYKDGELLTQSRNQLLSSQSSHFGFNKWVNENKEYFKEFLSSYGDEVVLYGEWAGKGIQGGVAIGEIDPAFFGFELRIYHGDKYDTKLLQETDTSIGFYDINEFKNWEKKIDFNNPEEVINDLIKLTEEVEKECPVAKEFGHTGVGEGIVWKTTYKDQVIKFKVKGEKHSSSKVKKLASVGPEKVQSIIEFVDLAVTENRVKQAIQETKATSKQQTTDILKWVANDIIEEESDTLLANDLEWKDVAKKVAEKTRQIFFKLIQ